jgi:prepilin-type N-terminal cleavage/methylation domain-containing protein
MTKPRKDGFTLIEMLTVIVIIVIVLSIGVPAFTNLMKSGGLSGASREVANALGLARQYAITHRTTTRVVFPYSGTTGTASTNLAPWYQSYAVLDVKAGAYVSKWEHLPLGTVFMDSGSAIDASVGNPPSIDTLGPPAPLPFPYANSGPFTLAYIEFQPTGAASQNGVLTITEGFISGGTAVTPTSKTSSNTLANQSIISVDNIIGRIKVFRP